MDNHIFPYSLGYESNPILPTYKKFFLEELKLAWRKCIAFLGSPEKMIIVKEDSLEFFFLIPEISYNLLFFLNPNTEVNTLESASKILSREFANYSEGGYESMKSFCYKKIPGTDILLGSTEYTQDEKALLSHPEHDQGLVNSLFGNISETEWLLLYEESFRILKSINPGFYGELSGLIKKIVPFGVSKNAHNSCSNNNIIGIIYSSYPIGFEYPEIAVLEALIHEYNHNKIHLILRFDKLMNNDKQTIYYSPYRPDSRHIYGIYLGLHAMVAVYYTLLKCFKDNILPTESSFFYKTIVYILKNQLAINTLNHYGKFTPLGEEIFQDMKGVHELCLSMLKSMKIDNKILEQCKLSTKEHFYKAKSSNRTLFY